MSDHHRGPLRSHRTGALVGAAMVAATAGLVLLLGGGSHPSRSGPSAASVSPSTTTVVATRPPPSTSAAPSPSLTTPPDTAPSSPSLAAPASSAVDAAQWRQVATGFATAFTTAPAAGQDWAAGLRPWVSDELATTYASTDPTRLPTGTLLQVQSTSETPALVVATVRYDSGLQLAIDLTPTPAGTGWVVRTVVQVLAG
jgi:hypothetical protein